MSTPAETRSAARPGALPLSLIAFGAAAGALLRWWLGQAVATTGLPLTTLAINVVGCFLLGALPAVLAGRRSPYLPLMLGPGFLGGFTTVSTWAEQSRELAADGDVGVAGFYIAATLAACAAAAIAGRLVAHSTKGPVR